MSGLRSIELVSGAARARILPHEGGVVSELSIAGADVLARTPWADDVVPLPEPARDEAEWVKRWRGGWQLCFPTAGQPEAGARPLQSFHGTASQAAWTVAEESDDVVRLEWQDDHGLSAHRDWRLRPDGLDVSTRARNDGEMARAVIVAEHLILGGDVVAPVYTGCTLRLVVAEGAGIAPLGYDGTPDGAVVPWPGDPDAGWDRIHSGSPARVAGIVSPPSREITVEGPDLTAVVAWHGLDHALLWEELAQSGEEPWNREVVAVGIEPTSTPHGAGTGSDHGGALTLAPGETIAWSVALRVTATGRRVAATGHRTEEKEDG